MTLPTILAIDTATDACSVALLHGERLEERIETVGQKHSERLLPMVDALLADAGIGLDDVDAYAFGAGPGSFTGLRIACGVVQGLAYACGRPVVAVGNLRALALAAFAARPAARRALAAIDARMNESYCAVYRNEPGVPEVRAPALESPAALPGIARASAVDTVAGEALLAFATVREGTAEFAQLPAARATAGLLARLARVDLANGAAVRPADAMPLYVRDRVALTIEERRAREGAA